jgi:hypothetical protein
MRTGTPRTHVVRLTFRTRTGEQVIREIRLTDRSRQSAEIRALTIVKANTALRDVAVAK